MPGMKLHITVGAGGSGMGAAGGNSMVVGDNSANGYPETYNLVIAEGGAGGTLVGGQGGKCVINPSLITGLPAGLTGCGQGGRWGPSQNP
jgi:hypothetical protein